MKYVDSIEVVKVFDDFIRFSIDSDIGVFTMRKDGKQVLGVELDRGWDFEWGADRAEEEFEGVYKEGGERNRVAYEWNERLKERFGIVKV